MSEKIVDVLRERIRTTNEWFLKITEGLTEEQWVWIPSSTAPPVRWHVWHIARLADMVAADLVVMLESSQPSSPDDHEIWRTEKLAERWGLDPSQLGPDEMGANMEDQLAATLPLPEKSVLLEYCRRGFQKLEHAADSIPTEKFDEVIGAVGFHISHTSRHVGMIEALRGVLGLHGTATN